MNLYTVDGGGIIRNIGRDIGKNTHLKILNETKYNKDFIWIISHLYKKKNEIEYEYDVFN